MCLSGILRDYYRVYVPEGSQLIEGLGSEIEVKSSEELGKTVFAGFFELRPQGLVKVTAKYRLPFKAEKDYKLFVQKQPGKNAPLYTISFDGQEEELYLKTDKEFTFPVK